MEKLLECVPNFSEGREGEIIRQIAAEIESIEGVKLLNVDPGKATNRTVMTFAGNPAAVVEAAFASIRKAAELIDMRKHKGEHPRIGATDVCPLIPLSGITIEEAVNYAHRLAQRVGNELKIPVYLYEYSQPDKKRSNLSVIREGEYEGFAKKIKLPEWKPDAGPDSFTAKSGATVIGVRDLLIAYNVNLNTTSVKRANSVAFDIRERGRMTVDSKGKKMETPGTLKAVKAIGWYIKEYGQAQVSINLTNIKTTPLHSAFEEVCNKAADRGLRVTGSEIVGMVPLSSMLDAGSYFLEKQKKSSGVSEKELVHIAVKSLGLSDLSKFDPDKKIIEYRMRDTSKEMLQHLSLSDFADMTASESPAPGGGSVAAYLGTLGAALCSMVANLSAGKKGWENRLVEFSSLATKGQQLKVELLQLVDEDTLAFNKVMAAYSLPKNGEEDKRLRDKAIGDANVYATEIPFKVMQVSFRVMELSKTMAETGNPTSISDTGVAALCARSAIAGAHLNVKINAINNKDNKIIKDIIAQALKLEEMSIRLEKEVMDYVNKRLCISSD